jgi:hypothetical protein
MSQRDRPTDNWKGNIRMTLPLGDINTEAWSSGMGVGRGANNPTLWKRNLLSSLQEIQPDFVEEAKA